MAELSPSAVAQFWSKVEVTFPQSCWPWKGSRNEKGYGKFHERKAHRVAYELFNGPIPDGLIARHKCDNPSCCNPHHLEPGTHRDNSADAISRNRLARGERHPRAKLTDEQVKDIRSSPLTGQALAKRYGVSKSTISGIRTYAHRKKPV